MGGVGLVPEGRTASEVLALLTCFREKMDFFCLFNLVGEGLGVSMSEWSEEIASGGVDEPVARPS